MTAPWDFNASASPCSRHGGERQLDLFGFLTNSGGVGLRGGMDLLLKMIGMPGKTGMDGSMVQEYFETGRLDEIHRYCRSDVGQTYFLFLRVALMRGEISEEVYGLWVEASQHLLFEDEASDS